ncbi:MAG: 4-phosphopantoate--beta-alanine ligase [Thermoplasmatota archaeon]
MTVPRSHPRYVSLATRDKLVDGWRKGLVATQGLIAHGRGEAFDYLLGERTLPEALEAEKAACYHLLKANRPVISVNGNVGALSASEIAELSGLLECPCEVNIFHRTDERVGKLVEHLMENGCTKVLGLEPDRRMPGLDHARALCCDEGIFKADVILVPLEDGDRCQALKAMGKKVITIDLNPLSRTSRTADITLVDNITRALPNMISLLKEALDAETGHEVQTEWETLVKGFDNIRVLDRALEVIKQAAVTREKE